MSIYEYVCICMCLPTPPHELDATPSQFFKQSVTGLNSVCLFSQTSDRAKFYIKNNPYPLSLDADWIL